MEWVTWDHIGVDRMACAWLIARFIDNNPRFAFIPENTLPPSLGGAEPFDIPGVRLSHRRGHCTFHTILHEYGIQDPVLDRIARFIDYTLRQASRRSWRIGQTKPVKVIFTAYEGTMVLAEKEVGPAGVLAHVRRTTTKTPLL